MTITAPSSASFRNWQPEYAAHDIPTFPVEISQDNKKPMVSNYCRFGLPGSAKISKKYPDATAIGFMAGKPTNLTILDVDVPDDKVLADALDRHGPTPIVVKTASGKYHAYYRHNGEGRHVRPWLDKPIDLLGAGFVVAPPSRGISGDYQFIQGNLDDLDRLPVMRNIEAEVISPSPLDLPEEKSVPDGKRHKALLRHCMKSARHCDDFDALLDVAKTRNDGYLPPMPAEDVMDISKWAWHKTETGQNRIGQRGAWFPQAEAQELARDPYLLALIAWLKAQNGPKAEFWIANGLATAHLGWPLHQLQKARNSAIGDGWIEIVVPPAKGRPALYRWGQGPTAKPVSTTSKSIPPNDPDDGYAQWLKRMNKVFN